jgi:hypothetical protein
LDKRRCDRDIDCRDRDRRPQLSTEDVMVKMVKDVLFYTAIVVIGIPTIIIAVFFGGFLIGGLIDVIARAVM